ncbi:DUF3540 domain-containing protein [Oceanobacter mangrovi]|uniref:DUF3540 domain-containing protein n=1 Tax=Oceanobacter mangrovi TaxID=2862510 RepID=UPI001C8E4E5C|nr:DUF3540 domain-containing protein [Oceanobacter mangrovi]
MNNCVELPIIRTPRQQSGPFFGVISQAKDTKHWLIDGEFTATSASSLLVQPVEGDLVGFIEANGCLFITQILSRGELAEESPITIQSSLPLTLQAPAICLRGWDEVELSTAGRFSLTARDGAMTTINTFVQQSEHLIQQVGHLNLTASGLLQLRGRQQLITAEEDVRIDGKRINMG